MDEEEDGEGGENEDEEVSNWCLKPSQPVRLSQGDR